MNTIEKNKVDIENIKEILKFHLPGNTSRYYPNDELHRQWDEYEKVRKNLCELDNELFGELRKIDLPVLDTSSQMDDPHYKAEQVEPFLNEILKTLKYVKLYSDSHASNPLEFDPFTIIHSIASKFHRVARQLRDRHNSRQTLDVNDEYDVQDLFHALLHLFFDDIRKEEWTPSYAGGSSRMDFLLKQEKTIIEIKITRETHKDRKIGEELIVDIEKYKTHPDCKHLYCFIYDPEGRIGNPTGLESDLSGERDDLGVKVVVEPK